MRYVKNCMSLAGYACAILVLCVSQAKASDDPLPQDPLVLRISKALSPDRFFMRAGAVSVRIKSKSGDTYDVTGPVVTRDELINVFSGPQSLYEGNIKFVAPSYPGYPASSLFSFLRRTDNTGFKRPGYGLPLVTDRMAELGLTGLGTPPGLTGEAQSQVSTAGISLGYYLGDDHTWAVEAYVLAIPPSVGINVRGTTVRLNEDPNSEGGFISSPILIDGQKIMESKMLPPLLQVGRYWGAPGARLRPYTGVMAMYAIFFDTKATDTLNNYVGGSSPGDTTVSFKNAFGMGPSLGFALKINDDWHVNLNVGSIKLKTVATITTRNTMMSWDKNLALQDLGLISEKISAGEAFFTPDGAYCPSNASVQRKANCEFVQLNGGVTSLVMKGIAAERGQGNVGTYVRKTQASFSNTLFQLGVGRSF